MDQDEMDEVLGITKCVRCGHRLNYDIECPFCSLFPDKPSKQALPTWIFITACFLTSPLSLYYIVRTDRLGPIGKVLTFSGCALWLGLYNLIY